MTSIITYLKDWRTIGIVLVIIGAFVAYRMQLSDRQKEGYDKGVTETNAAWDKTLAAAESTYTVQMFHLKYQIAEAQGQARNSGVVAGRWKHKADSVNALLAARKPIAGDTMCAYASQPASLHIDSTQDESMGILDVLYLPTSHDWSWWHRAPEGEKDSVVATHTRNIISPPLPVVTHWAFDPWTALIELGVVVILVVLHVL
jgi:hypothetical protein